MASDTEDCRRDSLRSQTRRPADKYSVSMRSFLLSQVMESWPIVTDTRVDDRAVYHKRRVWSTICAQFNERFPGANRSVQQLKDLWKRHSVQFRRESREEMALEEESGDGADTCTIPNETMFQKLLEWLEAHPGGDDMDEAEPTQLSDEQDEAGEEDDEAAEMDEPPSKMSMDQQDQEMYIDVDVKQEPGSSPSSRANTPSVDSVGSGEEPGSVAGAGAADSISRKSPEVLTSEDKHYLIRRCFELYPIIGSNRLDSPALRQKRKTWVEITTEYNCKYGRNLCVSTVKGVWRRFVKQRKDDLMKEMKLRNKEDVTDRALMDDMQSFFSSLKPTAAATVEDRRDQLPLYKQIKADVEERPITVKVYQRPQQMSPEQIINQLRRLAPAPPPPASSAAQPPPPPPPPLRAAGAAATRPNRQSPEARPPTEDDSGLNGLLDPRERLGKDVSITVVDPDHKSTSRGSDPPMTSPAVPMTSPAAVLMASAASSNGPAPPTPPLSRPATAAPLAAAGADSLSQQKHQIELVQMKERHQLSMQHMREKHQWELEKTRLEAEILSMRREYWRIQVDKARASNGLHPADIG